MTKESSGSLSNKLFYDMSINDALSIREKYQPKCGDLIALTKERPRGVDDLNPLLLGSISVDTYPNISVILSRLIFHGRFSLRGKRDGYIGKVVRGSISHKETLGCLSPAVDSSQPTYTNNATVHQC